MKQKERRKLERCGTLDVLGQEKFSKDGHIHVFLTKEGEIVVLTKKDHANKILA